MFFGKASRHAIAFGLALLSVATLDATTARAGNAMDMRGTTAPPIGFVQFCKEHLADCVGTAPAAIRVPMSKTRWDELIAVNSYVNRVIEPVTDEELYGVAEYWTYPRQGKGDCEDYVLLKRKMLMDRGWPVTSLLITVVRDTKNQGHAVLTVVTDRGDYVLDNQQAQVLPWNQTEYRYVKRQSQIDVARWDTIEDRRTDTVASTGR